MTELKIIRETFGIHGECWVAYDSEGTWRSYCKVEFAENAESAARAMFHEDEIVSVDGDTVVILTY